MEILTGLDIDLQGRLAVELDGNVHHMSARQERIGRCVGPSACHVNAHRASSPHNLVAIDVEHGAALVFVEVGQQALAEQAEGSLFVGLVVGAAQLVHLRTKHAVVDALHQWGIVGQRSWLRQVEAMVFARGVGQVELVEDALLIVRGQQFPVLLGKGFALGIEAAQVGTGGNLVGREAFRRQPLLTNFPRGRVSGHPGNHLPHRLHIVHHREEGGRLKIVVTAWEVVQRKFAALHPKVEGIVQVTGILIVQSPLESIVEAIGANRPSSTLQGHDVNAIAIEQH